MFECVTLSSMQSACAVLSCDLWLHNTFQRSHERHVSEKGIELKCVFIFYANFIRNISRFKNNSARYCYKCGTHRAPYKMRTASHSPGVKRPGSDVNHLPPSSAKVKDKPSWAFMAYSGANFIIINVKYLQVKYSLFLLAFNKS